MYSVGAFICSDEYCICYKAGSRDKGETSSDEDEKNKWLKEQKALLYESKTTEVINKIISLNTTKESVENSNNKQLQYYQTNKDRMDYKKYRTIGAGLIGSGAIESAHRTVIQKRMKLSGQRWTKKGAKNMLNLRCVRLSGKWDKVIKLICLAA